MRWKSWKCILEKIYFNQKSRTSLPVLHHQSFGAPIFNFIIFDLKFCCFAIRSCRIFDTEGFYYNIYLRVAWIVFQVFLDIWYSSFSSFIGELELCQTSFLLIYILLIESSSIILFPLETHSCYNCISER